MAGRPPKPLHLLKLEGTYRKDRHSSRCEDPCPAGFPDTPEDLTGHALKEWNRVKENDNGIIRGLDAGILEVYCTLWAEWKTNPAKMKAMRVNLMTQIQNSLYLNPKSRQALPTAAPKKKPVNGFDSF